MNLCPTCGRPNYNSLDICGQCRHDCKIMKEMIEKGHGIPKSRYPIMF